MDGRVHVYTGDGKGKTTAAMGLALRTAGAGFRVFIGQFLKKGTSAELCAFERFRSRVTAEQFGCPGFITGTPSAEDFAAAAAGISRAREILEAGDHDLVVLDEFCVAAALGLVDKVTTLSLIAERAPNVELVLTGRDAPPWLLAEADLVTEMVKRKHYFDAGHDAREGVEY